MGLPLKIKKKKTLTNGRDLKESSLAALPWRRLIDQVETGPNPPVHLSQQPHPTP